ncbi:ABC transporter ATP-binding protein [Kitasatospora sp. NPDC057223]|uniref:ABC transporter ATP-binding protein n=1 Tax=Kitasatospora sp. NPDC057223 TaxID=3346055 RepID=UPI00362FC682
MTELLRPVAELTDLRVEVGGRPIVAGVNLRVYPGRVTALLGASGSGKTTTGLALLGEYPPGAVVSGRIGVPADGVGYLPQQPAAALNPARRVGALLADIARLRGGGPAEVRAALLRARLADPAEVLRRFPHQLSGGQQQRVVLAQALLAGARVIVADEPTTGQDPLTKRLVVEELAAVAAGGTGILLLSHDLDVVRALADDVVFMADGRTARSGPAAKLLGAPAPVPAPAPAPAPGSAPVAPVAPVARLAVGPLDAHHPDGVRALHGVGLTVGAGECLALIGPSGSGKTTLGRCVAGLHSSLRGPVTVDGRPLPPSLRSRSRAELASVQYVFQDARAAFDEHRPVAAQVARTAVRLHGLSRSRAADSARRLLAEVGLPAALTARRPAELSGGELQRAALARALAAAPRVLVCDEITSGLDGANTRSILGLLAELRERTGLTVLLITHDLAAAAVADRAAVLDAGRIVEEGPAANVLGKQRGRSVAADTGESTVLASIRRESA